MTLKEAQVIDADATRKSHMGIAPEITTKLELALTIIRLHELEIREK